ncbi:Shedu anti-phage system protein SduA domain-containing protein [Micromonospora arida]
MSQKTDSVDRLSTLWLESTRVYPTRTLQSHLQKSIARYGYVSRLTLVESVVCEVAGLSSQLQIFSPSRLSSYLDSPKQAGLASASARTGPLSGMLLPFHSADLTEFWQEGSDLAPGQDYNLFRIQEWHERRPSWMGRYKDPRDIHIMSLEQWLRIHAHWMDRTENWQRRDQLFDFSRRSCTGKMRKADVIRELRALARAVGAIEAISGHFDGMVLLPRGSKVLLRPLATLTQGKLDFRDSPPVEGVVGGLGGPLGPGTSAPWEGLEDLINSEVATENDFQRYFEAHPDLLLGTDYERFVSQPVLTRQDEADLIPDFILFPYDGSKAPKILDLKLPRPKVYISKENRARYSSAVHEVRAQLLQYKNYFNEAARATEAKRRFGAEIFMPEIAVIIGRATSHTSRLDVLRARHDLPDLEVRTYDDVLESARRLHMGVRRPSAH